MFDLGFCGYFVVYFWWDFCDYEWCCICFGVGYFVGVGDECGGSVVVDFDVVCVCWIVDGFV